MRQTLFLTLLAMTALVPTQLLADLADNPLRTSRCHATYTHEFPTGEGISPVSDLIMTSDRAGFRFQASSMRCEQGVYFVTIIPERSLPDAPVVCGDAFRFREENGAEKPAWLIANGLAHLGEDVCGPVYLPVTRQIRYSRTSGAAMAYYGQHDVDVSYVATTGQRATVSMPNAADWRWFGQTYHFFHGASSGMFWGGAHRSGEGLIVTVEQRDPWQANPVVFLAMFTFDQAGEPMWLVSNYGLQRDEVLTFQRTPLVLTTGQGFGDNFNPGSIEREIVGQIDVHENGCVAKWFRAVGEPGWDWITFSQDQTNWRRLLGSYEVECETTDRMLPWR